MENYYFVRSFVHFTPQNEIKNTECGKKQTTIEREQRDEKKKRKNW